MHYLMALFGGVLVALMISSNGFMSAALGVYLSSLLIRIIGAVFAFLLAKSQKQTTFSLKKIPFYLYLGGCVGAASTLFNNYAYAHISVTAIMALSLFAESFFSLIVDSLGLFKMPKRDLQKQTVLCLCFSSIGIIIMLYNAKIDTAFAVLISLLSGCFVVLSRMMNARLVDYCGRYGGSFFNHMTGILMFVLLLLLLGQNDLANFNFILFKDLPIWAYLGGVFGVLVVYICNHALLHISAYQLSLLTFVGQVFTGFILDLFMQNTISFQTMLGAIFIAIGIFANFIFSNKKG